MTQGQRKPRGGWDEDDDTTTYKSNSNQYGQSQNISSTNTPSQSNFFIEQKLLDEITKPTGISYTPSDSQISELIKRAKNLNSEGIYQILLSKIYCYENYEDTNSLKSFCKALAVINAFIRERKDIFNMFTENVSLFVSMKEHFGLNNKKIADIIVQILKILSPEDLEINNNNEYDEPTDSIVVNNDDNDLLGIYSSTNQTQSTKNEDTKAKKFDFIKNKKTDQGPKATKNDQLDDIFGLSTEETKTQKSGIQNTDNTKILADNLFSVNDYDFSKTHESNNIDLIFQNQEKVERDKKLNELLSQLESPENKDPSKETALEVAFQQVNLSDTDFENHPFVQQQIQSQLNYLISVYGPQNKDTMYEYAKQTVLNNPLLKQNLQNQINKQPNMLIQSTTSSNIVICKDNKEFNSKKAFGEEEKKDSFGFVKDMLKPK